jgi:hypothetical protein
MVSQSLPLWVVPEKDEPAHGILLRLATRNGIQSPGLVAELTGLTPSKLRKGIGIDRLASLIQCDPDVIRHSTIAQDEAGHQMIRGHRVGAKRDVARRTRQYCPQCVCEQGHHRFWFDLKFVTSCPDHGVKLSHLCSCGEDLTWNDVDIVKCHRCTDGHASLLSRVSAHPAVLAMDAWVLGRLGVHEPAALPILDAMPFTRALDTIGRIGVLALSGFQNIWPGLDSFEMPIQSVRAHGFKILQEEELDAVFNDVYEGFLASGSKEKPTLDRSYGWFIKWLRFNGGEGLSPEIASILMSNASKRFQVHTKAFPTLERSDTSAKPLRRSARQVGMSNMTLRKLLEARGKLSAERQQGRPIGVDLEIVRELADDYRDAITFKDVCKLLGLSYVATRKLREAKEIPVWIPGGLEGSKHEYVIRKHDVESWVDALLGVVPVLDAQPPDTVALSRIGKVVKLDTMSAINGIRDKSLTVIGCLSGQPRLGGAVVSLEQAKSCVPAERRARWQASRPWACGPRGPYKKKPKDHCATNTVMRSPALVPELSECDTAVPAKQLGFEY